ncbi:MAG TPA: PrsW family glutamic-type intramembrane protease [Bacteroidales bacterium]
MDLFTYLTFAVSPVLILIGILILKFGFSIKIMSNIWNAVFLGILCVALVYIADYAADQRFNGNVSSMKRMTFYVFVVMAFSAELMKFLALRFAFYHRSNFLGPIEGIVYSIFIGLGYSLIAVILFSYDIIGIDNNEDVLLFLYTYPIANIIFSIAMGFFVGLAKTRKISLIDNLTGLGLATFLHGLYYFSFQTSDFSLLIITSIGCLVIGVTLFIRAVSLRNATDD